MLHIKEGKAQDVAIGVFTDFCMTDISVIVVWLDNFLLPFSFRLIHDLIVYSESIGHTRSADGLQVVQHVDVLGHSHKLAASLPGYLLEGFKSLEVPGREIGDDEARERLNAPLQASETDCSVVSSLSVGPARVPSVISTEASLALLTKLRVVSPFLPCSLKSPV